MSSVGRSRSGVRGGWWLRAGGYTLLELIAVLAVVGLALSVVMPSVSSGLHRWRLRAAVREMTTMLKFTRTQAVATRQSLRVVLDRRRNLYWLDRPTSALDADQAQDKGIRLYALPAGVHFGLVTVGGQEKSGDQLGVLFSAYGPTTGTSVQVVGDRGIGYRIVLDQVTGQASIRRMEG